MEQRRVVITGRGIVSCLGNDVNTVKNSLQQGESGIVFVPSYAEMGMRSQVAGVVDIDLPSLLDRKLLRFASTASAYSMVAAQQAIAEARMSSEVVQSERTGVIVGSGGGSPQVQVALADVLRAEGVKRVGPYGVSKTMASTTSSLLSTYLQNKGYNYSISSACATSLHTIGHGYQLIRWGEQDQIICGGSEEESWELSMMFDAMGALSSKFNDAPAKASRPYSASRAGFVIAGGGAIVVLETLESALKRGAPIYAEIVGYSATADGYNMVAPSGEGAVRCMRNALQMAHNPEINYINTHGTATELGDGVEIEAMSKVFGKIPPYSSTKSLAGHALGGTGALELVFSLLMMEHNFIAGSINCEDLDPQFAATPPVRTTIDAKLQHVMVNGFGFGGTNACLILKK